jgi:DNA-binding LacI/PurR family transcriptional regulator
MHYRCLRMARRTTIHDVAAAVGLSPTTVSHSLNGKGRVDPATRERVARAAEQLGYRANRTARRLRSGRSGTIALLLPFVEADVAQDEMLALDYYMHLAGAAARAAFATGHPVLLTPPLRGVDDLRDLGVDGGVLCDPVRDDHRVALFAEAGLPAVTVERDPSRPENPRVVRSDNEGNARALLDHLADAGARRIALLASGGGWAWADETEAAYRAWCADAGREPVLERASMRTQERSAYEAAGRLLDRERPDAIVAQAERYTPGVLRAARERGLLVPQDLRVAAAVDSPQARDADPPVTAIDLQPDVQGAAAAEMLVAILGGDEPAAPCMTEAELRVRASTLIG